MENNEIRLYAKGAGVPLWRLADHLGISEATLTRMLRRELPEDEKRQILNIIDELAKEEQHE